MTNHTFIKISQELVMTNFIVVPSECDRTMMFHPVHLGGPHTLDRTQGHILRFGPPCVGLR